MKVLFLGVFHPDSTNPSQANAFERNGVEVIRYDYRKRVSALGLEKRDNEVIELCRREKPGLVLFSKCNHMHFRVVDACNEVAKTCLWYMDPTNNFDREVVQKMQRASFVCCNIAESFRAAQAVVSERAHLLQEGFDPEANYYMPGLPYRYDVCFIGGLRNQRRAYHRAVGFTVFNDAYGKRHSEVVCSTRINLNFTQGGTSDRTYKVLASRGFLLTEPWPLMEDDFEAGKDLDVFSNAEELKVKIAHYLSHFDEAERIAEHGWQTVQKFSRDNWAKRIVELAGGAE